MQRYLFFNSVNDDRRIYQAQDFAEYFGNVLSTGLLHNDNVPGLEVSVETGTMNTVVDAGSAIMRGHLYINDTPHTLAHSLAEPTADRIDRIVLRLDLRNAHRNILLHVKEGVPSANPEPPTLQRDNFIYELSLAQVRIRANTSTIDPSDVTDERFDDDVCGLVYSLLGNSYLESQLAEHVSKGASDDVHNLLTDGKIIEESGSNSNGNYVKFADGTLQCWTTATFTYSDDRALKFDWDFPKSFIDTSYYIGITPPLSPSLWSTPSLRFKVSVLGPTSASTSSASLRIYFNDNVVSQEDSVEYVKLFAIGRWK